MQLFNLALSVFGGFVYCTCTDWKIAATTSADNIDMHLGKGTQHLMLSDKFAVSSLPKAQT